MICTNQNKGTVSVDESAGTVAFLWRAATGNSAYTDNPWVTNDNTESAKFQWIYTGDGGTEGNENVGDPVTAAIIEKLLYTDQGYYQPFSVDAMGWREMKAFMTPLVSGMDGELNTRGTATQASYLNTLTADTFMEKVIEYLKAPGTIQVWDGILQETATVTKLTTTLRDGDLFREGNMAPPGPPTWKSRDDKQDGEDWDTGLFYWEDSFDEQLASIDTADKGPERRIETMGLSRLHYWLLPKADRAEHWLKTGNDPHADIWKDHSAAIKCLAAGDVDAYPGDWYKRGIASGLFSTSRENSITTVGGSDPKLPNKKSFIKASAFTNWEGLLKNKPHENTKVGTNQSRNADTRLVAEGAVFTPDSVDLGGLLENTKDLTFDLATDVNKLAIKYGSSADKLAGEGWEAEVASGNSVAADILSKMKDSFWDYAGSKEKGYGPKEPQATAQWFTDNFTTNQVIVKGDDTVGPNPTKFRLHPHADATFSEDVSKQIKQVLEGGNPNAGVDPIEVGTEIIMEKPEYPWSTVVFPNTSTMEVPFEEILRMYQGAAYLTALHYRMARQNHDDVKVLLNDIWDHYAFKCAYHIYRIYERQLHDHNVGNFYAMFVITLARMDATDETALAVLEAFKGGLNDDNDKNTGDFAIGEPPEIEEETENTKDQRERFYKQCALLLNMDNLVNNYDMSGIMHEKSREEGYTSYNGRIHLVTNASAPDGQNNTILNKLVTPTPDLMKTFINIAPDKASELLPFIRFFRVWNDALGELQEIEFDFPQYGTREMNETFDRGDGVGMQEFTWECDGETPATASKYINATLTLVFQSFDDFTRVRKNKANNPFRWVDMFVSPTSIVAKGGPETDTPHTLRYDPEYYRIRVDVGYHPNAPQDSALGKALDTQNRSFFLVLKDNEITINKDMSVTIQANYGAYIEEAMDSNKFNALTTPDIKNLEADYKKKWDAATKSFKEGGCDDKELRQVRATINAQLEALIKMQHKSVMTNMLNMGRIFHVDMTGKDIDNYRAAGSFTSIPKPIGSDIVKPGTAAAHKLRQKMMAMDDPDRKSWEEAAEPHKDYRIYYFYFGDLIYLLNSSMYAGNQPWNSAGLYKDVAVKGAENTKLLLMDFDYHNPLSQSDNTRRTINIAHIPISVDFFFQWYVNNIIKNEVYHMGVGNFIKRMLTELITEALAEVCMSSEEGHYVSFQHGSLSVAGVSVRPPEGKTEFTDPITSMMLLEKLKQEKAGDDDKNPLHNNYVFDVNQHYNKPGMPNGMALPLRFVPNNVVLQQHDRNGVQGQFQYVYIYGDSKDPQHVGRGILEDDSLRGCYHLDLARSNGLVKNISFSKNNIPYLRESRMFNQGQAGLLQLSAVYDCEIEMIGNTLFLPGQEVWVNPYGFGGPTFGKPQDPPLRYDAQTPEMNQASDEGEQVQGDGNVVPEETERAAGTGTTTNTTGSAGNNVNLIVNSYANVMGIGGYQLIIRTKCTIKPGEFSTTINAKHTYSGYPMTKESLHLIEYRGGTPSSVASADASQDNACAAILAKWEDEALGG